MREFKIPTCNVTKFYAGLAKLNERIAKKGLDTAPVEAQLVRTDFVNEEINGYSTGNVFSLAISPRVGVDTFVSIPGRG